MWIANFEKRGKFPVTVPMRDGFNRWFPLTLRAREAPRGFEIAKV
jgi:hypothetical protein